MKYKSLSFQIDFVAGLECLLFCGRIGMPVILRPDFRSKLILRPFWNACYFAALFSFKIDFAALLECLLFCGPFGMPVILRPFFRSKLILRPSFRSKLILRL
ncbi:MAG: hypothetical protein DRR00_34365, partial [Candidatus Parabeggiatoa sp. nov. 3]